MKGNLFKDTRKKSYGYEPKEYARYKRQRDNKLLIHDKIIDILRNDDCKKLTQYKNVLEKVLVYYKYDYSRYGCITRTWLREELLSHDAFECFYYIINYSIELNVPWDVPTKYKERYFKRLMLEERVNKIKKLKVKINQEN